MDAVLDYWQGLPLWLMIVSLVLAVYLGIGLVRFVYIMLVGGPEKGEWRPNALLLFLGFIYTLFFWPTQVFWKD